jgi:hypothetical protein
MNLGRCGFQDSGHLELARMIAASEIGNLPFLVTVQCAPFTELKMATPPGLQRTNVFNQLY